MITKARLCRRPVTGFRTLETLLRRDPGTASGQARAVRVLGGRDVPGHLGTRTAGHDVAPQKNGHLALHVDDVDQARAELEAKGVRFCRRHARHRRVPDGVLHRSRRQRPDAPPSVRPIRVTTAAAVGSDRPSSQGWFTCRWQRSIFSKAAPRQSSTRSRTRSTRRWSRCSTFHSATGFRSSPNAKRRDLDEMVQNAREDWSFGRGQASYLEVTRDAWR